MKHRLNLSVSTICFQIVRHKTFFDLNERYFLGISSGRNTNKKRRKNQLHNRGEKKQDFFWMKLKVNLWQTTQISSSFQDCHTLFLVSLKKLVVDGFCLNEKSLKMFRTGTPLYLCNFFYLPHKKRFSKLFSWNALEFFFCVPHTYTHLKDCFCGPTTKWGLFCSRNKVVVDGFSFEAICKRFSVQEGLQECIDFTQTVGEMQVCGETKVELFGSQDALV